MPVELTGVNELRKALKQYAPDLDKQLKKELQLATENVVRAARGYAPTTPPLSNWGKGNGKFPLYNAQVVKNGIRLSTARSKKNKQGFSSSIRIVNASAAGSIYETGGRKNPNGRPQGATREVVIPDFRKDTGAFEHRYTTSTGKNYGRSNNPNAGRQFVEALNRHGQIVNAYVRAEGQRGRSSGKMKGRLIYRAWAEDNGKTQAAVIKAVMKTNDIFMKKTSGLITSGVRKAS